MKSYEITYFDKELKVKVVMLHSLHDLPNALQGMGIYEWMVTKIELLEIEDK